MSFLHDLPGVWYFYTLSGLVVGLIVGITGVGGGSLMTPILVQLGIPPMNAVGTDLLYASITKSGGVWVHGQKKNIDWRVTGYMCLGSLPAALLTVWALHHFGGNSKSTDLVIKGTLAFALFLTASALIFKEKLKVFGMTHDHDNLHLNTRKLMLATVFTGAVLGVLVSVSSIGAGAVGTVVLFFLYPHFPTLRIVGTDIAHAVPLTAVAGLGHFAMNTVNVPLLVSLLIGSLPGIYVGSHLGSRVPERIMRPVLATMLVVIGTMMAKDVLHKLGVF